MAEEQPEQPGAIRRASAQPSAAVDLSDVEGGNLNVRDVSAKEAGVRVQRARLAGDINIQGVHVGAQPVAAEQAPAPCLLVLAANPADLVQLALDEEIHAIDGALRRSGNTPRFDLRYHPALRVRDLQDLLLRYQPPVVHFCGHGQQSGAIVLQEEDGRSRPVDPGALAGLFALFRQQVRCVVLNACYSAVQAEAIAAQIDVVIGMTDAFSDAAAIEFAAAFYAAIGYGSHVQQAFALACNQVALAGSPETDIPRLLAGRIAADQITLG